MSGSLFNWFKQPTRRHVRTSMAMGIETCEARTLLSAASPIPAEVAVEHVHHQEAHAKLQFASLANYDGNWQLTAGTALNLNQVGNTVTGTQTVLGLTVGNFNGEVHGKKLKGELVGIGVDAHSTIKVKLTDANHFAGKRHFFINGASEGTQPIVGVKGIPITPKPKH